MEYADVALAVGLVIGVAGAVAMYCALQAVGRNSKRDAHLALVKEQIPMVEAALLKAVYLDSTPALIDGIARVCAMRATLGAVRLTPYGFEKGAVAEILVSRRR